MATEIPFILDTLYAHHGRMEYEGPDDLLGVLVRTILSQQTTRHNCTRAFDNLIDTYYGDWARIQRAPLEDIEEVIAVAGLAGQKARRIQAALQRLDEERGEHSLEFLRQMPVDEARDYLTSFKGVGPKTAAFTLMYAAGMSAFPMDTHILRIAKRLGWIDESTSSGQAHRLMEERIPAEEHYSAHMVLVRHGRAICHARNPDCHACPIRAQCPSAQSA
ncbi:endonuclease III [Persicimonas caeni]|uniref:Endonuclease III n=1 Tax=Persicimonas caeni TaxID=2292766 RepID=A0A4Y6PNL0_PERCE|nr:endonuclease III [Persicimonas caeni]QDG49908.1 endonuclease III [Persicimonas caeni]QED31129.1 endonuclease III [Persicimonas caeni]